MRNARYFGGIARLVRNIERPSTRLSASYPPPKDDIQQPITIYQTPRDFADSLAEDFGLTRDVALSYCNNDGRLQHVRGANGKVVCAYSYGGVHGRIDVDRNMLTNDRIPEALIQQLKARTREEAERAKHV